MERLVVCWICLVLNLAATAPGGDSIEPRCVEQDSTAILRFAVSCIEMGLQRGESDAALKRFSEDYREGKTNYSREMIRNVMTEILIAKTEVMRSGNNNAGIYFDVENSEFVNNVGKVWLSIYLISGSTGRSLVRIRTQLDFARKGGAWLLQSSDDFLSRILQAYRGAESDDEEEATMSGSHNLGGKR
jgi:hypothetical protein